MKQFLVIIRTLDDHDYSVHVDAASEREALTIIDRDYEYLFIVGCHRI
jgi:hypothetical protein